MSTKLSHVIGDVLVGLLVAGVLMGGLVPLGRGAIGPATAVAVAVLAATAALLVGRRLRRRSRGGG